MDDRRFFFTLRAVRRQVAAMPCDYYFVCLIHHHSREIYPGDRVWTAPQMSYAPAIGFLRARNREGYDVYFRPYKFHQNAGYLLLDLDQPELGVVQRMRHEGHAPCVVVETSPGRLQAWVHVSATPLASAEATTLGRALARHYGADPASADWCHFGRLAGFTNQKPARRQPDGQAPWVKLTYARVDSISELRARLASIGALPTPAPCHSPSLHSATQLPLPLLEASGASALDSQRLYQSCLKRLRILERYPQPNWSITDLWVAQQLLGDGLPASTVQSVLEHGSPGFPRQHPEPTDYLCRTIRAAIARLHHSPFPARAGAPNKTSSTTPYHGTQPQ